MTVARSMEVVEEAGVAVAVAQGEKVRVKQG